MGYSVLVCAIFADMSYVLIPILKVFLCIPVFFSLFDIDFAKLDITSFPKIFLTDANKARR